MIVTNAGWVAVDAAAFCVRWDCRAGDEPVSDQQHADERCCSVRRSRVVLTPRRWRQVRGVASALPGLDKTYPQTTVAKEPGHRGARRSPLKPLRAGMPGVSGVLVVTRVRSTTTIAHETAGALGIRHSPRPLRGERFINGSGAWRGEVANVRLELGQRHCERSNPGSIIPGWSAGPDPESRDSGFDASHRPGMTESGLVRGACHRARIRATRWLAMMVWTASLKRHLVP